MDLAEQRRWAQTASEQSDLLVGATRARWRAGLAARDRATSILLAGGFLASALALLAFLPVARHPAPYVYPLMIGVYALVARVEFEFGTGAALPSELVLVPMLFVLPLSAVPLCVAAALMLAHLRGKALVDRALLLLTSSWHTVGPVLVLGLALRPHERDLDWRAWPLYAVALAAQFAFDLTATSARDWLGLGVSARPRLRFMAWVYAVDATLAPVGLVFAFAADGRPYLVMLVLPLVGLLKLFAREREQRIDHALELSQAYRGTSLLLGDVIEADDAYTGSHSRDVVTLTLDVCEALGLSYEERRDAEFVALLHDIGKIRIPGEIINKPGSLTEDERRIIETHTIEGEKLLEQVGGLLGQVGRIVRSCHERWDGKGYPDGLRGEEIPLVARVVCTTDAYSAMTTNRSYRRARRPQEALEELVRCAGTHFDPQVVDAIVRVVRRGEADAATIVTPPAVS
jgi:HD-GYP domain-containing protein (c-di-GMP phosphodiesterase class II)